MRRIWMLIKGRRGGKTPREWVEKQNVPLDGKSHVRDGILENGVWHYNCL